MLRYLMYTILSSTQYIAQFFKYDTGVKLFLCSQPFYFNIIAYPLNYYKKECNMEMNNIETLNKNSIFFYLIFYFIIHV